MARNSLFDRYEVFVASAVLGAFANSPHRIFRQLDVRLMIEVFTNWVESVEEYSNLPFQNTQIARYLENLINEGFARKLSGQTHQGYRLTRTGLIEIISRIVDPPHFYHREHFYFVYYFIDSYRESIIRLVKKEGKKFPYALQVELDDLLDVELLLGKEMQEAKSELRKLSKRIQEARETRDAANKIYADGIEYFEFLKELEHRVPMALNASRRYVELFERTPEKQGVWELTLGNDCRTEKMWMPAKRQLEAHILEIERFQAEQAKK
jgi:hypothetical protein